MADEADKASDTYELHLADSIQAHRRRVERKLKDTSEYKGECDLCGYDKPRLVARELRGATVYACAACRDEYKLG